MRRLLFVLALSAAVATQARAQAVLVSPAGDMSSLVGMPFTVPIVADWSARSDKLGSFAVRLTWDPAILAFTGGSPGSFGNIEANTDTISQGVIRLAGINPQGASGAVSLINLVFTPLVAANTAVQLTVAELYSTGPTFADVLPSATVQSGLFCPARGYWGDADLDRAVGSRDALIALSVAVGLDVSAFPQVTLADVDNDGAVRAKDALVILSYAVGLDVSPFRVARLAVGGCGTDLGAAYSVTPNGDTLVAGDNGDIAFDLRATAGGVVRIIPDAFWKSSNPGVLAILSTGEAVALSPGTAVVTGKSGSRDSATATITVVAHRSRHYVDARAVQATNQLGSAAHPYEELNRAAQLMQAGDTIVVLPGNYQESLFLANDAVILGRPSGNDWPVLKTTDESGFGIGFFGTGRSEVHGLRLEGFDIAVVAPNADVLIADSVRTFVADGQCATAAISVTDITTLTVRWAQLKGSGSSGPYACDDGVQVLGTAHTVTVEDATITDFGHDAVHASNVDSVAVRRSNLSGNGSSGVDVDAYVPLPAPSQTGLLRSPMAPAGTVALVLEDSRLFGNLDEGVWASNLRSAAFARNVTVTGAGASAANLFGQDGTGTVSFSGDSILFLPGSELCGECECFECAPPVFLSAPTPSPAFTFSAWIQAEGLDEVTANGLRVRGGNGIFYNVGHVGITNSSFLDVPDVALEVSGVLQSVITLDSVHIVGDPAGFQDAQGLSADNATSTVNRLRAENLDEGIDHGEGALSVTNSAFVDAYYGIYAYSSYLDVQKLVVQGVTFTGATNTAIESDEMVTVVDNTTITGDGQTEEGIYAHGLGADTVRTTMVSDVDYGIDLDGDTSYVVGNTVRRTRVSGVYVSGMFGWVVGNTIQNVEVSGIRSVDTDSLHVSGNLIEDVTIPCCYTRTGGIAIEDSRDKLFVGSNTLRRIHGTGISIDQNDTATAVVDTNAVSYADTSAVTVLNGNLRMHSNNIQNNARMGVYIPYCIGGTFTLHGNAFRGNAQYAVYDGCENSIDASGNWWGGGDAGTPGNDNVSCCIDVSNPLTSIPIDVPALAPPVFATVAVAPAPTSQPARVRGARPVRTFTAGPVVQRRAIPTTLSPALAAARANREARWVHTLEAFGARRADAGARADSLRAARAAALAVRNRARGTRAPAGGTP